MNRTPSSRRVVVRELQHPSAGTAGSLRNASPLLAIGLCHPAKWAFRLGGTFGMALTAPDLYLRCKYITYKENLENW